MTRVFNVYVPIDGMSILIAQAETYEEAMEHAEENNSNEADPSAHAFVLEEGK